MKPLLRHPAFPDIVEEWARQEARDHARAGRSNDNEPDGQELSDPLLVLVAQAEIEATRLW
jgi:hypothetical protein